MLLLFLILFKYHKFKLIFDPLLYVHSGFVLQDVWVTRAITFVSDNVLSRGLSSQTFSSPTILMLPPLFRYANQTCC